MLRNRKKLLSSVLPALAILFAVLLVATTAAVPCSAALTPDTPGLTKEMIQEEMREKYLAFFDRANDPNYDILYEKIPVEGDADFASNPAIKAKTAELTNGLVTDREKALAIYKWIINYLSYDFDYIEDRTKGTYRDSIEVFENKRTVCEGYANLYTVMCRDAGVPCRIVSGLAATGSKNLEVLKNQYFAKDYYDRITHAWNEVYFDGAWHMVDATWDSYNRFEGGQFNIRENTDENPRHFVMEHRDFTFEHMGMIYDIPMKLGDFLVSVRDEEILGKKYVGKSSIVIVPEQIDYLSYNMFMGCTGITEIVLPGKTVNDKSQLISSSVKKITVLKGTGIIPSWFFGNCPALEEVVIPAEVTMIEDNAFYGRNLKKVYFGGTPEQWAAITVGNGNTALNSAEIIYTQDHIHNYNVKVLKQPSCAEFGLAEKTCSCGYTFKEYIEKLPHTPTGDWYVVREATCRKEGFEAINCSVCGGYAQERYIPMIPHKLEDIEGFAPTCTQEGRTAGKFCTLCFYIIEGYDRIEKLPHTPGDWIIDKEPTCTEKGLKHQICSVCNGTIKTEEIPQAHKEGQWQTVKEPTCSEEGLKELKCSVCGEVIRSEKIEKLPHTPVIMNAVPATCTNTGLTEGKKCSVCGEILVPQTVIEAKGHTFGGWIVVTAPTCTAEGIEKRVCTVCGAEETRAIEAKGHTFGGWTVVTAPTCTAEGIEKRVCTVCGAEETRAIKATGHKDADGDKICDTCGSELNPDCNHLCHSQNKFIQFIWKIINFFNKLFKINQYCECGARHW